MSAISVAVPANFSSLSIDANGRVDLIKIAGTTQTARNVGGLVDVASSSLAPASTAVSNANLTTGRISNLDALAAVSAGNSAGSVTLTAPINQAYSAWVQLIASTGGILRCLGLQIQPGSSGVVDFTFIIDIGIGAGGSEVAILPAIAANDPAAGTFDGTINLVFPLVVASGVRVAVRIKQITDNTAKSIGVFVQGAY